MGWAERARPKKIRVALGYPAGGSVTLPFHASVLRMQQYQFEKSIRNEHLLGKVMHVSGLYVGDNRQVIARKFLESDCDWLLQIDTDIEFPPDIIERMVRLAGEDKKVLAASVPLGAYESCAFRFTDEPGVWRCIYPFPAEVFECDGVATAVVLIHREVFRAIAARHGRCWFHHIYLPESSSETPREEFEYRSQGEDLALSVRIKEAGYSIWCAHVPGLKHYKTRALSHDHDAREVPAGAAMGELLVEA